MSLVVDARSKTAAQEQEKPKKSLVGRAAKGALTVGALGAGAAALKGGAAGAAKKSWQRSAGQSLGSRLKRTGTSAFQATKQRGVKPMLERLKK